MKNKVFRIDCADSPGAITVQHSGDFPGNVLMITADKHSREYFGDLHLDLPAELMRELGQALCEIADEAEKANK